MEETKIRIQMCYFKGTVEFDLFVISASGAILEKNLLPYVAKLVDSRITRLERSWLMLHFLESFKLLFRFAFWRKTTEIFVEK
jgi:hypothetical protein